MATAHIGAAPGDLAPLVLMPGDPRRARRIAESFLHDARQVTAVRGILGYTGLGMGQPMSVLAFGWGSRRSRSTRPSCSATTACGGSCGSARRVRSRQQSR